MCNTSLSEELYMHTFYELNFFFFFFKKTFPEPMFFNKDSSGFEIVTDAKKECAKEIKDAIRSGRRVKKIYRPVYKNSFSPLPLIPIGDKGKCAPPKQADKEIDTSFPVKVGGRGSQ